MKRILKNGLIICLALLLCTTFVACGLGQDPQATDGPSVGNSEEKKYNEACDLIEEEKYEEAYELLKSISNYAPAQERLKNFLLAPQTVTETSFVYTMEGRVPQLSTYKYVYSANGNVEKYINVEYDREYIFTYNQAGNPLSGYDLPNATGSHYFYFYKGDLLTKISEEDGYTENYFYNDNGLVEKITSNREDNDVIYTYQYEYHANKQIKTMAMVDVHDGVKYVYAYSETGVLEKIDVIELRDEQEATFGTLVMTYGAYGLEKVVFNLAVSDAKAEHIYTYDKNGKLTDLTVNFDGMDDSYQYSFSDYKLCYSENPVTHERISLITRTHPKTIFEFYN